MSHRNRLTSLPCPVCRGALLYIWCVLRFSYFTGCGLTDDDLPGVAICLDEIGRDGIKRL